MREIKTIIEQIAKEGFLEIAKDVDDRAEERLQEASYARD